MNKNTDATMNITTNIETKTGKLLLQKQQISRADLDTVTGGRSLSGVSRILSRVSRRVSLSGSSSSSTSSTSSGGGGGSNESQNGQ